jgi:signal transduction histidine kinase
VRVAVDPVDLTVHVDAERVHQVVANLLENAARHSPAGAPVEVAARLAGTGVVIEVTDRGPGIPPEERIRVFERFHRSDAARTGDDGGAGLGLAIARWIVELHGGAIRADQRPAGPGCRMVIVLPAAPTPVASRAAPT